MSKAAHGRKNICVHSDPFRYAHLACGGYDVFPVVEPT